MLETNHFFPLQVQAQSQSVRENNRTNRTSAALLNQTTNSTFIKRKKVRLY
jgi:hypothetical protein